MALLDTGELPDLPHANRCTHPLASEANLPTRMRPSILPGVHNAGRSQMAAGFARSLGEPGRCLLSGSEPAHQVNPVAIAAMAEKGIDIGGEQPRRWVDDELRAVTSSSRWAGRRMPFYPGKRYLTGTDRPGGQANDEVRLIRDDIERRVRGLLAELESAWRRAKAPSGGRPSSRSSIQAVPIPYCRCARPSPCWRQPCSGGRSCVRGAGQQPGRLVWSGRDDGARIVAAAGRGRVT
jgi:hypothetical protein